MAILKQYRKWIFDVSFPSAIGAPGELEQTYEFNSGDAVDLSRTISTVTLSTSGDTFTFMGDITVTRKIESDGQNITIKRNGHAVVETVTAHIEVTEFVQGISIQRVSGTIPAGTSAKIFALPSSIVINKTFPIPSVRCNTGAPREFLVTCTFPFTGQINLQRVLSSTDLDVEIEVATLDSDAGLVTEVSSSQSTGTADYLLSAGIDINKTFSIFTCRYADAPTGSALYFVSRTIETGGSKYLRIRLNNTTLSPISAVTFIAFIVELYGPDVAVSGEVGDGGADLGFYSMSGSSLDTVPVVDEDNSFNIPNGMLNGYLGSSNEQYTFDTTRYVVKTDQDGLTDVEISRGGTWQTVLVPVQHIEIPAGTPVTDIFNELHYIGRGIRTGIGVGIG